MAGRLIAVGDIQRMIQVLKKRGIGVLITDHNVRETLGICDRAYIVNQGHVFASGIPSEIVADERVREVYLGRDFRLWSKVYSSDFRKIYRLRRNYSKQSDYCSFQL